LVQDDKPWERASREGWEGVIAKRRGSPYEHRRSKHWLKMKCEASQEFVVGGFTDPQGARVGLGALLVGYYDRNDLAFAGKIGTGFDTKLLTALRKRLNAILRRATLSSLPSVISGSTTRRSSFAFGKVVRTSSCVSSEAARLRNIACRCDAFLLSLRPDFRWRIEKP
jgi:ATP-dependent DNA ligase